VHMVTGYSLSRVYSHLLYELAPVRSTRLTPRTVLLSSDMQQNETITSIYSYKRSYILRSFKLHTTHPCVEPWSLFPENQGEVVESELRSDALPVIIYS